MSVRYYDWIAHFSRRTPDKTALIDLASARRFSYAELDARISRLAAHLRDTLKIARGDRVAVPPEKLRQQLAQFVDTHLVGLGIALDKTRDGEV